MKIERINENQIRCTLTREDLEDHQMKLSELAYGTEKARRLFQEMMQQAQLECGFEAENMPIMIEAIPVNMDSIILLITKVEDPEELDTRFSKFAPFRHEGKTPTVELDGADEILDLFRKLRDAAQKAVGREESGQVELAQEEGGEEETGEGKEKTSAPPVDLVRVYHFSSLDAAICAAHGLEGIYEGENSLYKDKRGDGYQLVLHQSGSTPEDFNKVCNILSEYASGKNIRAASEAYLAEHGCLVTAQAMQKLAQL